jgi:hypothetical protein
MSDLVPDSSWISVATFDDLGSATVRAEFLLSLGIPASTWTPTRSSTPVYVLVPPERIEEAKEVLTEPPPSEDELTQQALAEPPPDDQPSGASTAAIDLPYQVLGRHPTDHGAWAGDRPAWLRIGLVAAIAIVIIKWTLGAVLVPSDEIAESRAPDGQTDAVLLEIQRDAHGEHSLRVCLRPHTTRPATMTGCTDVAYLSGAPRTGGQQGVELVWNSSSELEIRYIDAKSAFLYRSLFTWSSGRATRLSNNSTNRMLTPIRITLSRIQPVSKNYSESAK